VRAGKVTCDPATCWSLRKCAFLDGMSLDAERCANVLPSQHSLIIHIAVWMLADEGRLVARPDISFHAGGELHPEVHPQTLGFDDGFVVGTHDGSFWSETAAAFILDT
jgi:hypothetical protein